MNKTNMRRMALVFLTILLLALTACAGKSTTNQSSVVGSDKSAEIAKMSVEEKVERANDLAHKMAKDGMNDVLALFSDFEKIDEVDGNDPRNMMKMGPEEWHYSKEANITVVECVGANSPIHVFTGKKPSQAEIDEAIKMMREMMENMGSMEDM